MTKIDRNDKGQIKAVTDHTGKTVSYSYGKRYVQVKSLWEGRRKYSMNNKKRILFITIISLFLLLGIYIFYEPYIPYEEIPFEYAGSALGKVNMVAWMEAEDWANEEYVYNSYNGYFIAYKENWEFCAGACRMSDFDFEPQFEDNQVYVCTYGYQLKTLEYSTKKRTSWSKKYYNRATLWTDDYQEGTYYFYKIGEIGYELGNMLEDKAAYSQWFS